MSEKNKFDIFKGKEENIKKKYQGEGYNWEKIKKELQKKIEIEQNLDKLEHTFDNLEANSEAHIKALESLLGNLEDFKEKKGIDFAKEKVKQEVDDLKGKTVGEVKKAANEVADKATDAAVEKGKSFLEKIVPPGIMGFFKKLSFATEKFSEVSESKGFFSAIGVFFAILAGKVGFDAFDKKEDETKVDEGDQVENTQENNNISAGEEKIESKKDQTVIENRDKIDSKKEFYYTSGIHSLLHFSGIKLEYNDSTKKSMKKFQEVTLAELREVGKQKEFNGKEIDNVDKKVIETLLNDDCKTLLKSSLKEKVVKLTLENNYDILSKLLRSEDKDIINGGEFSIDKLSLNAISILSLFSINSFGLLGMEKVGDEFTKVFNGILPEDLSLEEIKSDMVDKKEGVISKQLLTELNKNESIFRLSADRNDTSLKESLKSLENQEEVEKLIRFKNFLLSQQFLGENSKSLLGKFDKEKIFKENLTYAGVVALYTVFGGTTNFDNISALDLVTLYKIESVIIGRDGKVAHSTDFLREVVAYLSFPDKDITVFADNNDKKALEIISNTILKDIGVIYINQIKEKLGYIGLFNDSYFNDLTAIGVGLGGKRIGKKLMKKGAVLKGGALTKTGYALIFSGLASAINTSYNTGSKFLEELRGFNKKESDLLAMEEGALEAYLDNVGGFNDRIVVKNLEINGESKKVLLFLGKKGLEVIYDNKIYSLTVGFSRFQNIGIQLANAAGTVGVDIIDASTGMLSETNIDRASLPNQDDINRTYNIDNLSYNGEKYDFSKVVLRENEIVIGNNPSYTIKLDDFLTSLVNNKDEHPRKIAGEGEKKDIIYKVIEKGNGDNNNLILLQQGSLETKKD